MKKLMMVILLAAAGNMLQAQTPTVVREKFKTTYPDASSVYWKSVRDNAYRVNYVGKEVQRSVVYDKNGNVVSEEMVLKTTEVPMPITDYYKKKAATDPNYSNYTIWEATNKDGSKTYYSEYKGKTVYFDKDGSVITRKGMATGDEMEREHNMQKDK